MSNLSEQIKKIPNIEKAAILLLSLSEKNLSKVLSLIDNNDVVNLAKTMSNLGVVDNELKNYLLKDVFQKLADEGTILGNSYTTKNILKKALDHNTYNEIIGEIKDNEQNSIWQDLLTIDEEILAVYLKEEHPQTIAIILSKLSPFYISKIITHLGEILAIEVMNRLLHIDNVKKNVLIILEEILQKQFINNSGNISKYDNIELLAETFNNLIKYNKSTLIKSFEIKNPDLAHKIKEKMFQFEDIAKFSESGLQKLISSVDRAKLALALKGTEQEFTELFLKNMSQKAAKILQEEINALGGVRAENVYKVRGEILAQAQNMINRGEIEFSLENDQNIIY
ncbi:MAG: hypothetical protein ISN64_03810 [Rickettsia sp.]|nr:hypothetical protein [Rickettsia sp.]